MHQDKSRDDSNNELSHANFSNSIMPEYATFVKSSEEWGVTFDNPQILTRTNPSKEDFKRYKNFTQELKASIKSRLSEEYKDYQVRTLNPFIQVASKKSDSGNEVTTCTSYKFAIEIVNPEADEEKRYGMISGKDEDATLELFKNRTGYFGQYFHDPDEMLGLGIEDEDIQFLQPATSVRAFYESIEHFEDLRSEAPSIIQEHIRLRLAMLMRLREYDDPALDARCDVRHSEEGGLALYVDGEKIDGFDIGLDPEDLSLQVWIPSEVQEKLAPKK
ncbi:hypothetical protein EBR25_07495 [bacterium]|nr:hypothetical protein [bacterium]